MPKLLDVLIAPPVILYFTLERFVTGKPNTPVLYAAELLEDGFKTKIHEVSIGTPEKNDKNAYYFPEAGFNLTESDLKRASKILEIPIKYLRLIKWEDNRIALAISDEGLLQIKNRIESFPSLWHRLRKRFRPEKILTTIHDLKN